MISYLTAETSFIRAYGNRTLLLCFLCILTRTGNMVGKASAFGISIDLSPGQIAAFGPILSLLIVASLKIEADSLVLARQAVLDDLVKTASKAKKRGLSAYALFAMPAVAAAFLFLQYVFNVVPASIGCAGWSRLRDFYDFTYQVGTASIYCMHDVTEGMPWIYPPIETFLLLACVGGCIERSATIAKTWGRFRG